MPGVRCAVPVDRVPTVRSNLAASRMVSTLRLTLIGFVLVTRAAPAQTPAPRALLPIDFEHSAESRWLKKKVEASRVLDDMSTASTWRMTGTATMTFPSEPRLGDMRVMRVDMRMFTGPPAPTSNHLSAVNLRREFGGDGGAEDWRAYNRLSFWVRADIAGFPMLPLQIVLHNDGAEKVPDRYGREGIHYVTVAKDGWQHVTWEIEPLARDRVTSIEIGYWVNKMLAAPMDRVAFEIGRFELQRVEPDHHTGWDVAPGRIAFSNSGYRIGRSKTAIASDLTATTFDVVRVNANALGTVVLRARVLPTRTRLGRAQVLDFSAVNEPGRYVLRAGDVTTQPFRIGDDVW